MDRDVSLLNASRRSMAVGIWTFLLVLSVLAPAKLPILAAVVFLLAASLASGFALLLMCRSSNDHQGSLWERYASVCTAVSIPLLCSFVITMGSNQFSGLLFAVVAVLPIAVMRWTSIFDVPATLRRTSGIKTNVEQLDPISAVQPVLETDEEFEERDLEMEFDLERSISIDQPSVIPEESISSDVTQWLTRSSTADAEIIEGGVRIDFADGQRDATIHISFCPPLTGVPEITTEDLDGRDLEVRVSAAFPFGVRFAVRRSSNSRSHGQRFPAETCRIGFVASVTAVRRAA